MFEDDDRFHGNARRDLTEDLDAIDFACAMKDFKSTQKNHHRIYRDLNSIESIRSDKKRVELFAKNYRSKLTVVVDLLYPPRTSTCPRKFFG